MANTPILKVLGAACWVGLLLSPVTLGNSDAPTEAPAELYRQLTAPQLDPSRAIVLEQADVPVGDAWIRVHSGVLVPTRPIAGRTVEWVFVGQARFRFSPPDEIEADQLALFAGQRELDVALDAAVMVQADDALIGSLLEHQRPTELSPSMLARVKEVHREWLTGAARQASGIQGGIFNALVGDAAFKGYFAIWCNSFEIGSFIYEYDPEDTEPHTLAHFSPIEIRGWDRMRLERHLNHQQRKGRWLDTRIQDLGDWDIWLSGPWDPTGELGQAALGFEPEHYELDVHIENNETTLRGRARLKIRADEAGRRVIPLELFRDLRVESVRDASGRSLFHFRSGGDLVVVLPQPTVVGQKIELELNYSGKAVRWVGRKVFDLEHTSHWYPHCGTVDRATYDVTLHWPAKLNLLASGRVVDAGRKRGRRWERRLVDVPAIAFSFVLGRFLVEHAQAGHVELEIGFNRGGPHRLSEGARGEVIETVQRSLAYFEETFGPYPLDHLTVVLLPRRYSQSFLGFVTLTDSILPPNTPPSGSDMSWYRSTTIAHEIAHQWWGNLIGWSSYRDQWLSEAMANYSALQFWADTEDGGAAFLAQMSAGWRESLNQPTPVGRSVESLGPIVLGVRLNSTLADNGYRAIVYRKGAVVLAMLARAVGQRPFGEMMRSLVDAAANRVVSTDTFLRALEHMSGLDLDGFARRYIYGTGIPAVYYSYDVEGDEGSGWTLRAHATLAIDAEYQQSIQRSDDGFWDVRSAATPRRPSRDTALMVPYRVAYEDGQDHGNLLLEGEHDEFDLAGESRPIGFDLDPRGEILATFYSEQAQPKKVATLRANDQWIAGEFDAAEQSYRNALQIGRGDAADTVVAPTAAATRGTEQRLNAQIRLRLARLALDRGDPRAAILELDHAINILGPDSHALRIQQAAIEGRIELRQGNYEAAFKLSKKALRLTSPRRQRRHWRLRGWQARVGSDWHATTEVLAVLAIAAFETGNRDEFRWAVEGARERGVDLSDLEQHILVHGSDNGLRLDDLGGF